jgi:hypothetical protein
MAGSKISAPPPVIQRVPGKGLQMYRQPKPGELAQRYERNNRPNAANRAEETLRTSLWQSGTRRC